MPPQPQTPGLVVDLDGVLRRFDQDLVTVIEDRHGLPRGVIGATAFEPGLLRRAVTGEITDERWRYEVALELAALFGSETAAAAVTGWAALAGRVDPAVRELLAQVAVHTPVVLLTNATTRLEADLAAAGLGGVFTAVVSSARTGFPKPDPRAFAAAEQALRSRGDPARGGPVAYVDDDPGHVAAAGRLGWDAWLFTGSDGLRDFLADRLLLWGDATRHAPTRPAPAGPPPRLAAQPWILLGERPGLSGHWVRGTTATFSLPDGTSVEWDLLHEPDAVAVLALTADGHVILARQYRPGPDAVLDELPGGLIDDGEDPADAAARELLEETGYAGKLELLGWAWQESRSGRRMWTAVATGCVPVAAPEPGPSEHIDVVLRPVVDFVSQVRAGALTDSARAYRALDHLGLLALPG